MNRKSDETLTSTTKTASSARPIILRVVPGGESQPKPLKSAGVASQTQRKRGLPTQREDNDDDPGPTAA